MGTPLALHRKSADRALAAFAASSGLDPEEVWQAMLSSDEMPEVLTEYLEGDQLWYEFQSLRNAEIKILKELRP
jgi:hypothetical protein